MAKIKIHLCTTWNCKRGVEVYCHSFFTMAQMEVRDRLHAAATSPRQYPLNRMLVVPQSEVAYFGEATNLFCPSWHPNHDSGFPARSLVTILSTSFWLLWSYVYQNQRRPTVLLGPLPPQFWIPFNTAEELQIRNIRGDGQTQNCHGRSSLACTMAPDCQC